MVIRFKYNIDKVAQGMTVFDRNKQKNVGGFFKAKGKYFVYKFSGRKIILSSKKGYSKKTEALVELKKLF